MAIFAVYQCKQTPNLSIGGFQFVNSWLTFDASDMLQLAAFQVTLGANPTVAPQIQLVNDRLYRDSLDNAPESLLPVLIPGPIGTKGRSIVETAVDVNRNLMVTYDDGSTVNAGVVPTVVGPKGDDSTVPGPKGADSTVPGPKGADSTVPGPPGPASTVPGPKGDKGNDSTVPGPPGPQSTVAGPPGPKGADSTVPGRGIASTLLDLDNHLIITYTDGATQDVGLIGSGAVVPAAAGVFGPVGFNVAFSQLDYDGSGFPFLDRAKNSSVWQRTDNTPLTPAQVNANGYPLGIPAGSTDVHMLFNVEGPAGPPGVPQQYVLRTTLTDPTFGITDSHVDFDTTVNGLRRIGFTLTSEFTDPGGNYEYCGISNFPTRGFSMADTFNIVRADEEAAFVAGEIFTAQFLARFNYVNLIRMMDWCPANRTNVTNWSERPQVGWSSWGSTLGVPLEIQIALCNKVMKHGWFHIPVSTDIDYSTQTATLIKNTLSPALLAGFEFGNENWNYNFGQYGYLFPLQPVIPGQHGDQSNRQAGYRAANRLATIKRVFAFSPRCLPILSTQSVNTNVTLGYAEGINYALAEWANPQSANPDAELAAHFDELGKLFSGGLMMTSYFNGLITWANLTDASKATVEGWAAATDGSGITNALRQMEIGDLLPEGNGGSVSGLGASLAGNIALANQYQIPWGCYEGNMELYMPLSRWQGQPNQAVMQDFFNRIYADAGTRGMFARALRLIRSFGATVNDLLAEFGAVGDPYATLENAYGTTVTPRGLGLTDYLANPGPAKQLTITSITTTGNSVVGAAPVTRLVSSGGLGIVTFTVTGLVPGKVFDGFRTIKGTLTQENDTAINAIVTATDQSVPPQVVTANYAQVVGPTPTGKRYLVLKAYGQANNPGSPPPNQMLLSEIRFKNSDGTYIAFGNIVATGDTAPPDQNGTSYPPSRLVDNNGATFWAGIANQTNTEVFDFAAAIAAKPAQIEMQDVTGFEGYAPGDYEWFWSDDDATLISLGRTKVFGGTTPGNAYYNPGAYNGNYGDSHVSIFVPTYPA